MATDYIHTVYSRFINTFNLFLFFLLPFQICAANEGMLESFQTETRQLF